MRLEDEKDLMLRVLPVKVQSCILGKRRAFIIAISYGLLDHSSPIVGGEYFVWTDEAVDWQAT